MRECLFVAQFEVHINKLPYSMGNPCQLFMIQLKWLINCWISDSTTCFSSQETRDGGGHGYQSHFQRDGHRSTKGGSFFSELTDLTIGAAATELIQWHHRFDGYEINIMIFEILCAQEEVMIIFYCWGVQRVC